MAAKKARNAKKSDAPRVVVAKNRKARHQYEVLETFEAGILLVGTEVKTMRGGKVSIEEAYGRIDGDEVFLIGAHIEEYTHGNRQNHDPTRRRKLLLRKREITKLVEKVTQRGLTLIPLELYFSERGYAKVALGLCRGQTS